MENQMKFVEFDVYCKKCKYRDRDENLNPCCDCLEIPARENTHIPEYWEGADKTKTMI